MGAYPQIVDWNEDGKKDLLVGDAYGYVSIFLNQGTNQQPNLTHSGFIQVNGSDLTVGGKATPCVNDWNEDGKKDLLIGREDGRVTLLIINEGANENPSFNTIQFIQANGSDLDVGFSKEDRSAPKATDLDGDGLKDLIIGQKDGKVYFYSNSGTNVNPVFSTGVNLQAGGSILTVGGYSRLDVVDWDEDGDLDLLVGEEQGYVNLFRNSTVGVDKRGSNSLIKPLDYALLQNYPNPFNQRTKIQFLLPENGPIRLSIYNSCGQLIAVLIDDFCSAGGYEAAWDSENFCSGSYFAVLDVGGEKNWIKMLVVK